MFTELSKRGEVCTCQVSVLHMHLCEGVRGAGRGCSNSQRLLPIDRLDAQVVPLVASLDEANAGDLGEGQQTSLDDGALTRG